MARRKVADDQVRTRSVKPSRRDAGTLGPPEVNFRLSWRDYFLGFCGAHGEPVQAMGRLLFPDGWSYSSTDYKGPEWPPPAGAEQLAELLRAYWDGRLAEVERQQSIDHFQFTRLIADHYDLGQKMVLAEVMWGVILADGTIGNHEAYLVRKIAHLLQLEPGYLAEARRAAAETPRPPAP